MHHPSHPERFHALDATRAFALLLGVVFHAAWFYTIDPTRTPVNDVQANHFLGWFFHGSHTFRMQLFYLIAGFFARLVFRRRGLATFARNRLVRIGVPMVVGWLVLYPLLMMVWMWGKNLSGQNAAPLPPHLVALYLVFSGAFVTPRSEGGAFVLFHLWFLYYLLVFYVIALGGYGLITRSTRLADWLRTKLDRFTLFITTSHRGLLLFSILLIPMLWIMDGWMGIDTPAFSLVPMLPVTAGYFSFFLLGWLIHRQIHRLGEMFRSWKIYLVAGLIGTVGVYVFYMKVRAFDANLPMHSLSYRDVQDWSLLRTSLLANHGEAGQTNAVGLLWQILPPDTRQQIEGNETFTFDQKVGLLETLNKALMNPGLLNPDRPEQPRPPAPPPMDLSSIEPNRMALQEIWHGVAPGDYRQASWYGPAKWAYSTLYAVTSVLLVFGCLGAFQAFCQGFSPSWRYLADSSYWVYLIHLPVVPALEIPIYNWPLTSWIKFPLLLVLSFVLLYGSYHYLVRSTFIGKILNGRAYPFHAVPWHALRVPQETKH